MLTAVGCEPSTPGVLAGEDPVQVCSEVVRLLAHHRVWERFPTEPAGVGR